MTEPVDVAVSELPATERRLPESMGIDDMSVREVLSAMNDQDRVAVDAVRGAIPELTELVEVATGVLRIGGRIHYFGAGTSGRLGVLDAAELLPTFNLPEGRIVAHIAGGAAALIHAVEDAEDAAELAAEDATEVTGSDLVLGLTASGNTPYVRTALRIARERGARTALISCNPVARAAEFADIHVFLNTGAEFVTGSTRLKAGTAQKLALNGFSTALMISTGKTWSNLMVSVVATNAKLRDRTVRILREVSGLGTQAATDLLAAADGDLRVAVVASLTTASPSDSRDALEHSDWSVRDAILALTT